MSDCGCCDPVLPVSPRVLFNRPGLSALKYRIGTFSSLRRAMIEAAASQTALIPWTSRDTDDYGIDLIELWAVLGDILTFYQERIANEAFLRTAVQRDSLMRLAALIDYKLAPGVAATAFLAFIVDRTGPSIPTGLRVQSKPAPGQTPATFETEAALTASAAVNQVRVWPVPSANLENYGAGNDQAILFSGGADLKPGQPLVFFAGTHIEEKKIESITPTQRGQQITWSPKIAAGFASGAKVYRLGRKFNLFGNNAPAAYARTILDSNNFIVGAQQVVTVFNLPSGTTLFLEGEVKDLKVNSQVLVVIRNDDVAGDFNGLFTITAVTQVGQTFGPLTNTVTQLELSASSSPTQVPAVADLRSMQVYELTSEVVSFSRRNFGADPAQIPAGTFKVYSDKVKTADLTAGSLLMIADDSGKAEQMTVTQAYDYSAALLEAGTVIEFTPPLAGSYSGETAVFYGNVVKATHGETVKDETLGSGDGSQASQEFTLKKSPVTFTPDKTADRGARNSLQIMVNGIRWQEAPNFFGRRPDESIYATTIDEGNKMTVEFGDGVTGARLPTGVNNVHAKYRKGWGKEGSVNAGKLTTLLDARPGLKSVSNPAPSFGWADPETLAQARRNAPTTVMTFERAVSLEDFELLSRSFPGVGKARAAWVWNDEQQVIRLTCAGSDGVSILPVRSNLLAYLDARRDPNRQLEIVDFTPVGIQMHAYVVPDPGYDPNDVLSRAQAAVGTDQLPDETYGFFAFERLDLDEDIHLSEVYAALQSVPGVVAVYVDVLHRKDTVTGSPQNIVPIGPSELAVIADPLDVTLELKDEI
jgi:hypothetical protein